MATVELTTNQLTHTVETNDLGAAMLVERLSTAFAHGGVWIPADHQDTDVEGTASLRWLPAATTTVHVTFTEGTVPEALAEIPGYLVI